MEASQNHENPTPCVCVLGGGKQSVPTTSCNINFVPFNSIFYVLFKQGGGGGTFYLIYFLLYENFVGSSLMIMKQFQIVHKMTNKICSLQRYIKTLFIAFQFCQCLQSNIRLSIQFLLHDPGGLVKAFIIFCHLVYKNWFDVSISFYRERFSISCYK